MPNLLRSLSLFNRETQKYRSMHQSRDKDKRIKAIEAILRSFSDNGGYPLVNILSELSHTEKGQFNAVFKKILEWRNELNQ